MQREDIIVSGNLGKVTSKGNVQFGGRFNDNEEVTGRDLAAEIVSAGQSDYGQMNNDNANGIDDHRYIAIGIPSGFVNKFMHIHHYWCNGILCL